MLDMSTPASAPAHVEQWAGSNVTPGNNSLFAQRVEQLSENIPLELRDNPSDNETWFSCLVLSNHFELFQAIIECIPRACIIGQTSDDQYHAVIMCEPCIQWLVDNNFPFLITSETGLYYGVSEPREREIPVYGIRQARQRAQHRFLHNAKEAILSGRHGQGLVQHLRHDIVDNHVKAAFEWTPLICDILESPNEVFQGFLQHCVFVAVHSLGNLETASVLELLTRSQNDWLVLLGDMCEERAAWPANDARSEMHLVSLVQGLFESAAGRTHALQRAFNFDFSSKDNIRKLGSLLGCHPDSNPMSFGSCEKGRMKQILSRCKMFEDGNEIDVTQLEEKIRKYIPVWSKDVKGLPTDLGHALPRKTINGIRVETARTYHFVPSLQVPGNDMLVLLYYCARSHTADPAICEWVTSPQGTSFYWQNVATIQEKASVEQTVLRVVALLSFRRLFPYDSNEKFGSVSGCYLEDFRYHLYGGTLYNERDMWDHMARSIRRVVGEKYHHIIRLFLDTVVNEDLPLHCSDTYWGYKLYWGMDHADTWRLTGEKLKKEWKHRGSSGQDQG